MKLDFGANLSYTLDSHDYHFRQMPTGLALVVRTFSGQECFLTPYPSEPLESADDCIRFIQQLSGRPHTIVLET